jgi:hypothetical protein
MNTRLENFLVHAFAITIIFVVCVALGYLFARAFIIEDVARVEKLERHFYGLALDRAPAPPQNVRPNFYDLAEPKTKVFQDASQPRRTK